MQWASAIATATKLCTNDSFKRRRRPFSVPNSASGLAKKCVHLLDIATVPRWYFANSSGLAPATVFIFWYWSLIRAVRGLRTSTHGTREEFLSLTVSNIFATQKGSI